MKKFLFLVLFLSGCNSDKPFFTSMFYNGCSDLTKNKVQVGDCLYMRNLDTYQLETVKVIKEGRFNFQVMTRNGDKYQTADKDLFKLERDCFDLFDGVKVQ